jgi:hypothetical protein
MTSPVDLGKLDNEPCDSRALGFVSRPNPKNDYRVFEGLSHVRHSVGVKAGTRV